MIAWDRLEVGELTYAQSIGMPGRDSTNYKPCSSWSCVGHSFTVWFKEHGKLVTHLRSRARLYLCAVCRLAEQNDGVLLILLRSPFTERWEPLVEEVLVTLEKVTNYKPCTSWSCVGHSFTIWFKDPEKLVTHLWSREKLHYAKSGGKQNRTTVLCFFICGHQTPNAERKAMVKDVWVTLEKVDKLLWCTDLDLGCAYGA